MNKSLIILVVLVAGYLGLDHLAGRWRQHLKEDPYAVQLDTAAARRAIATMDEGWAAAATHFAAADFAPALARFEASLEPLGEFTFRFGDKPYADGKSLRAWLADHQAAWAAGLSQRRPEVVRAMTEVGDLALLEKFRRRLNDARFDAMCADVRADIAVAIRTRGSALVVDLNESDLPRRQTIDWVAGLRAGASPYLLFARPAEAATLGDLPFVGFVRVTTYANLSQYEIFDPARRPSSSHLPGLSEERAGLPERMDVLLEPDPFAQRNLGLQRRSCSSIEIKLPESFELPGTPAEFIAGHRRKIITSLESAIGRLPKMTLRANPEYGFCALQPRPVMAGGAMPSATSDSPVAETYRFRP